MANIYTTIAICSPGHTFDVSKFNDEDAATWVYPDAVGNARAADFFGDHCPVGISFLTRWEPPKD
jgi:hypothetical protein